MTTIDEELERDAVKPRQDKLDALVRACEAARDLEMEITDLKDRVSARSRDLAEVRHKTLPDMFMAAGVTRVDLAATGNLPASEARMTDHYKAGVSASWPQEQQDDALDWLENRGEGDLIKRVIEVSFAMGEEKLFNSALTALGKIKGLRDRVAVSRAVPWQTLTAWLREIYVDGEELGDADLRRLGASVGKVVNIKPVKER